MKPQRDISWILGAVTAALLGFLAATLPSWSGLKGWNSTANLLPIVVPVLATVMALSFATYWLRTLSKHPYPLKVALLGAPQSGKTVFLSVLFHELQTASVGSVVFQPYGRETIETVSSNLRNLCSGFWLKPTSEDSVFFFRANAAVGSRLFRRRYTIEIGDYAGERIEEFDSASERWLHRTEYFNYAIACDVLFLAVDGGRLAMQNPGEIEALELQLIAALQVLMEERGVEPGAKLRMPVALLILKSDLLLVREMSEGEALYRLDKLVTLCRTRCREFETFFVSAVGLLINPEKPPPELTPVNVVQPMIWALRKIRIR